MMENGSGGEGKKTILLVDDEVILAMNEKLSLEKYGYDVITVNTGEKALGIIENSASISLVLMDIDLGKGIDGTEAARLILRVRDIPVVFLSSHTSSDVVAKTEKITSYGYVVKSSSTTVLDASIKMAFKLFEAKRQVFDKQLELESANRVLLDANGHLEKLQEELRESESLLKNRLEFILNPDLDILDLDLGKFIDIGEIGAIMENFTAVTGMVTAVLDLKGKVLIATGWQDICVEFHRANPETAANCTESDGFLAGNLKKGEFIDYRCKNGLWDVVTPLFLGDKHFGNIFSGQFFYDTDSVDEGYFSRQAEIYGFDKAAYIGALRRVPRYDKETIGKMMRFLVGFFTQISRNSLANILLAKQSAELERAKESARKSEKVLRSILNTIPQAVFWKDGKGLYMGCNQVFADTVGLADPGEIIGKSDFDLPWPEDEAFAYRSDDRSVIEDRTPKAHIVEQIQAADGTRIWADTTKLPIFDDAGEVLGVLGIFENISERKQAEEKIGILLAEKELILKEAHHRIKNNMSVMRGLLALQAAEMKDSLAAAALEDAARRLQSMELLYEKLYQVEAFSELSIKAYLSPLVDEILANLRGVTPIKVEKRIDDFPLDARRLQPLGILVNELLTNVMKHAFAGREEGRIVVTATRVDGRAVVIIQDDGNGIPESVDFKQSTGFGLMLIGALATQLNGTIRIERGKGTRTILDFEL
jgi:PAS domain S-box-containing protein